MKFRSSVRSFIREASRFSLSSQEAYDALFGLSEAIDDAAFLLHREEVPRQKSFVDEAADEARVLDTARESIRFVSIAWTCTALRGLALWLRANTAEHASLREERPKPAPQPSPEPEPAPSYPMPGEVWEDAATSRRGTFRYVLPGDVLCFERCDGIPRTDGEAWHVPLSDFRARFARRHDLGVPAESETFRPDPKRGEVWEDTTDGSLYVAVGSKDADGYHLFCPQKEPGSEWRFGVHAVAPSDFCDFFLRRADLA